MPAKNGEMSDKELTAYLRKSVPKYVSVAVRWESNRGVFIIIFNKVLKNILRHSIMTVRPSDIGETAADRVLFVSDLQARISDPSKWTITDL